MSEPRPAPATTLLQGELRLAGRLDARFFALLRAIEASGSLQKAARAAGYSYKGAWLVLETAGNLSRAPLLHRQTGGAGGGGSRLTPAAQQLLQTWDALQARHAAFMADQEAWLLQQPHLNTVLRRLSMKATARNQFAGTVTEVLDGPATAQVTMDIGHGLALTAHLTAAAAARLALAPGREVIALVKASDVVLVAGSAGYRLSAANQLGGSLSRVTRGAVSSLLGLTLPGGATLTASVTNDAVDALGLAVGQPATAAFQATAVMVAVQD